MIQFNLLILIYLGLYLLRSGSQLFLTCLNLSHLRQEGRNVPEIFKNTIDQEKFGKISAYTMDSEKFGMAASLVNQGLFLAILLSGFLPWFVNLFEPWGGRQIVQGLFFFAGLSIFTNLFHIPFRLYDTFVIEERYGFNVMTFKIWISDLLKSITLSAILGGLLLWLLFTLIVYGGNLWWLWAWVLVGGFELLMLWLYPMVIAPLFNKFEPIRDESLEHRIRVLT